MTGTGWSLLPFLIVIPISVLTRQVIPGLLAGLLVGAYMTHPTLLGGMKATLQYLLQELAVSDNLRLVLFLYGFGSFVGLIRVTGGVSGFAHWMGARIKSVRSAFALTWLSSLVTFMAPDFRIITVAPVMARVFQKLGVRPEHVALDIDLTSTPLCAVIPIGTAFVGYMVGLIHTAVRHYGISGTPYHWYLLSLPFNFFSVGMLLFGLIQTFLWPLFRAKRKSRSARMKPQTAGGTFGLQLQAEFATEVAPGTGDALSTVPSKPGAVAAASQGKDASQDARAALDPLDVEAEQAGPRVFNLLGPLFCLLGLTFFLTWWDGHSRAASFWGAMAAANAAVAMLEALLITLVASLIWYTITRQPMSRTMLGVIAGGNEMMGVIVLLSLVWAVSAVSTDLGFTTFVEGAIGRLVPASLIAPVLFIFGCLISYVIGSSFGTWGMLMPLAFSLAASTHASLPLIIGAVFASGTFGGFVSPLSDNTVAMATVLKLPLMSYARQKLKSGLLVAGVCTAVYGVVGFL